MGEIVLDAKKVNSYVYPNLDSAEKTMENAYNTCKRLRNSLDNSFPYRTYVNEITSRIYNYKTGIRDIKRQVEEKIEEAWLIEKKSNVKMRGVTSLLAGLVGGIGAGTVAATHTLESKTNNTDSNEKTWLEKTGSKISKGFTSICSKVSNGVKKIGAKISNGVKSVASKIGSAAKAAGKWVGNAFKDAKEWTTTAIKDTGAWIAKAAKNSWSWIKTAASDTWKWVTNGENWKKLGASIVNGVLSLVKGVVSLVEAIGDLVVLLGGAVGTIFTGAYDIIKGICTGEWKWSSTKSWWNDKVKTVVSYEWSNELDKKLGWRQYFDKWAYKPFKSDGMGCQVSEGIGYIAGIIALTVVTCGAGSTVVAVGGGSGVTVGSAAASVTGATITVSSNALVAGGIAAGTGMGKNTSAAWNDGATVLEGLGYGAAKGAYEGVEMTLGYAINGLKVFKGAGVASQLGNTASHVVLDAADGASGALVDPILTMIYSPNEKNVEDIMRYVNYDSNGNRINDKTWDELTFGEKYNAIFQYKGGWNTVATQALMAGGMSLLSEIPDIVKVIKAIKATNVTKQVMANGMTEATVSSIKKLEGDSLNSFVRQSSELGNFDEICKQLEPKQIKMLQGDTLNGFIGQAKNFENFDEICKNVDLSQIKTLQGDALNGFIKQAKNFENFDEIFNNIDALSIKQIDEIELVQILEYFTAEKIENMDKETMGIILKYFSHSQLIDVVEKLDGKSLSLALYSIPKFEVAELLKTVDDSLYAKIANHLTPFGIIQLINGGNLPEAQFAKLFNSIDNDRMVKLLIDNGIIKYSSELKEGIQQKIIASINYRKYPFFAKNSLPDGFFGADQDATRKFFAFKIKSYDWLDNEEELVGFLSKKINKSKDETYFLLQSVKNEGTVNLNFYNLIVEYLSTKGGDTASIIKTLMNSFEQLDSPILSKLKLKLMNQGMSEIDAILTLKCINTTGVCSYAEVANSIFSQFKNHEELFKKYFGFDLYTMVNGTKVLNSSELLVDMYTFMNSNKCGNNMFEIIEDQISIKNLDTTQQVYLSTYFRGHRVDIINLYLQSKNPNFTYKSLDRSFIDSKSIFPGISKALDMESLKKEIITAMQSDYDVGLGVVKTKNGIFRFVDSSNKTYITTNDWAEGGGHVVHVVGVTDNEVIVSSWGRKLCIKYEDFLDNKYAILKSKIGGIS